MTTTSTLVAWRVACAVALTELGKPILIIVSFAEPPRPLEGRISLGPSGIGRLADEDEEAAAQAGLVGLGHQEEEQARSEDEAPFPRDRAPGRRR
jgi:hypothetical protein